MMPRKPTAAAWVQHWSEPQKKYLLIHCIKDIEKETAVMGHTPTTAVFLPPCAYNKTAQAACAPILLNASHSVFNVLH